MSPPHEVTVILNAVQSGDTKAAEELLPLLYRELRQIAGHKMAGESAGHTLQPTALVHEAWLRLVGGDQKAWPSRAYFFAAAAEAMRRILIDRARRKQAARHGGGQPRLDIGEVEIALPVEAGELLVVNDALEKLAAQDAQKAELVKLRYFVGLTIDEAAEVLGISVPTANRWWNYSRAWLYETIERERKT